mmetsp:Transcript_34773/g.64408  ORF Transcript_34773/g.64408 Transcript_34773/m.64408 type:complete len:1930 (-) Transcript_34773:216-6005(-)
MNLLQLQYAADQISALLDKLEEVDNPDQEMQDVKHHRASLKRNKASKQQHQMAAAQANDGMSGNDRYRLGIPSKKHVPNRRKISHGDDDEFSDHSESVASANSQESSDSDFLNFEESELRGFDSFNCTASHQYITHLLDRLHTSQRVDSTQLIADWFAQAAAISRKTDMELDEKEDLCIAEFMALDRAHGELQSAMETRDMGSIEHMRRFYNKVLALRNATPNSSYLQKEPSGRKRGALKTGESAMNAAAKAALQRRRSQSAARRRLQLQGELATQQKEDSSPSKRSLLQSTDKAGEGVRSSLLASELLEVISCQQDEIAHLRTRADMNVSKTEAMRQALEHIRLEREEDEEENKKGESGKDSPGPFRTAAQREAGPRSAAAAARKSRKDRPPLSEMGQEELENINENMRMKGIAELLITKEGRSFLERCGGEHGRKVIEAHARSAEIMEQCENLQLQMQSLQEQIDAVGDPRDREEHLKQEIAKRRESMSTSSPRGVSQYKPGFKKKSRRGTHTAHDQEAFHSGVDAEASGDASLLTIGEDAELDGFGEENGDEARRKHEKGEDHHEGPGGSRVQHQQPPRRSSWVSEAPLDVQQALANVVAGVEQTVDIIHQRRKTLAVALDDAKERAVEEVKEKETREQSGHIDFGDKEPDKGAEQIDQAREKVTAKSGRLEELREEAEKLNEEHSELKRTLAKLRKLQKDGAKMAQNKSRDDARAVVDDIKNQSAAQAALARDKRKKKTTKKFEEADMKESVVAITAKEEESLRSVTCQETKENQMQFFNVIKETEQMEAKATKLQKQLEELLALREKNKAENPAELDDSFLFTRQSSSATSDDQSASAQGGSNTGAGSSSGAAAAASAANTPGASASASSAPNTAPAVSPPGASTKAASADDAGTNDQPQKTPRSDGPRSKRRKQTQEAEADKNAGTSANAGQPGRDGASAAGGTRSPGHDHGPSAPGSPSSASPGLSGHAGNRPGVNGSSDDGDAASADTSATRATAPQVTRQLAPTGGSGGSSAASGWVGRAPPMNMTLTAGNTTANDGFAAVNDALAGSESFNRARSTIAHGDRASPPETADTERRATFAAGEKSDPAAADAADPQSHDSKDTSRNETQRRSSVAPGHGKDNKVVVDKREEQVQELLFYQQENNRLGKQIAHVERAIRDAKAKTAAKGDELAPQKKTTQTKDTNVPEENRNMRREVVKRQRELNDLRKKWWAEKAKHGAGAYDGTAPGQVEMAMKLLLREPPDSEALKAKMEEEAAEQQEAHRAALAAAKEELADLADDEMLASTCSSCGAAFSEACLLCRKCGSKREKVKREEAADKIEEDHADTMQGPSSSSFMLGQNVGEAKGPFGKSPMRRVSTHIGLGALGGGSTLGAPGTLSVSSLDSSAHGAGSRSSAATAAYRRTSVRRSSTLHLTERGGLRPPELAQDRLKRLTHEGPPEGWQIVAGHGGGHSDMPFFQARRTGQGLREEGADGDAQGDSRQRRESVAASAVRRFSMNVGSRPAEQFERVLRAATKMEDHGDGPSANPFMVHKSSASANPFVVKPMTAVAESHSQSSDAARKPTLSKHSEFTDASQKVIQGKAMKVPDSHRHDSHRTVLLDIVRNDLGLFGEKAAESSNPLSVGPSGVNRQSVRRLIEEPHDHREQVVENQRGSMTGSFPARQRGSMIHASDHHLYHHDGHAHHVKPESLLLEGHTPKASADRPEKQQAVAQGKKSIMRPRDKNKAADYVWDPEKNRLVKKQPSENSGASSSAAGPVTSAGGPESRSSILSAKKASEYNASRAAGMAAAAAAAAAAKGPSSATPAAPAAPAEPATPKAAATPKASAAPASPKAPAAAAPPAPSAAAETSSATTSWQQAVGRASTVKGNTAKKGSMNATNMAVSVLKGLSQSGPTGWVKLGADGSKSADRSKPAGGSKSAEEP